MNADSESAWVGVRRTRHDAGVHPAKPSVESPEVTVVQCKHCPIQLRGPGEHYFVWRLPVGDAEVCHRYDIVLESTQAFDHSLVEVLIGEKFRPLHRSVVQPTLGR